MTEQQEPIRAPLRRVISKDGQTIGRSASAKSMLDKRKIVKISNEIEEREKAAHHIHKTESGFTRNDRKAVEYDADQLAAVDMVKHNQFGVIGGYAGSGKTTTAKEALRAVENEASKIDWLNYVSVGKEQSSGERVPAIGFLASMNVAARNLASKLPEKWANHCMSIHKCLAFAPVDQEAFNAATGEASMRFEPRYHANNPLPLDILFIDEAGTMPRDLWHQLLDACEPTTRIYFIGDLAQLPSMRAPSPMPFAIQQWPFVELKKIYRQEEGGALIGNLTRIRQGIEPVHDPEWFRCGKTEELPLAPTAARKYIGGYVSTLYKRKIWDPQQDIIITPENDAALGQATWNTTFRYAFNPQKFDEDGRITNPAVMMRTAMGVLTLCLGDKVMATDNGGRGATERRFVNGSIGTVIGIEPNPAYKGDMDGLGIIGHVNEHQHDAIDLFSMINDAEDNVMDQIGDDIRNQEVMEDEKKRQASHIVTVIEQATGETFILSRSAEIANLDHAYAATAHKFQGSQARNVLVICHENMISGHFREWLYTACSRARERVFLLHTKRALSQSVTKQRLIGRNPTEKAEHLMRIYEKNGRQWGIPRLPKNMELK